MLLITFLLFKWFKLSIVSCLMNNQLLLFLILDLLPRVQKPTTSASYFYFLTTHLFPNHINYKYKASREMAFVIIQSCYN